MFVFIQSALLIFALRVTDMTLATVRVLMVMRGRKLAAWVLGFFQASVFILAISAILTDMGNWLNMIGYAAGFATGNVVGIIIEERLAIGHTQFNIISSRQGPAVLESLRAAGFAVTEIPGRGKDGMVTIMSCSVLRKHSQQVLQIVQQVDDQAFITSEEVRPVRRGFWA